MNRVPFLFLGILATLALSFWVLIFVPQTQPQHWTAMFSQGRCEALREQIAGWSVEERECAAHSLIE